MLDIKIMQAFMLLGDMPQRDKLSDSAVAYKEKIAFATMRFNIPGWQPPSNWNSLTNEEKIKRLDKLQSV